MSRRPGVIYPVLAVLVALLFFGSLRGWSIPRSGAGPGKEVSFHGGKNPRQMNPDSSCSAPECHASSPHRKTGPSSAFLNMHRSFVSCLGCHGRDPERHWGVRGTELVYSPVPDAGVKGRRHDANGPPAACRRCHSTEGRRAIAAAGVKDLHDGFEEPIVLRMIEGGGRKWLPDDMR
ncbi:MAG: hypothetical protein C4529_02995 [Deltaproteobacteria bacterium]|nr:MAG: hypothetical protein C4529_02995 [Deltaproteobacteria bacterium]